MRLPLLVCGLAGLALTAAAATDYPFQPVPFTDVKVHDNFWSPRFETNRTRTVWYDYQKCEETGRIDNFAKAAKLMPGNHKGDPFDDSDVYKVIEGAAYCLALQPDPKLEAYTDALIDKIAAAQEPDGYLYTARTIHPDNPPGRANKVRWLNERGALGKGDSHELYNAGHMYEAAVAYYRATGKRKFLDVALKHADLVAKTWGPGPGQLKIPSGHQEIEIGLVKLYRVTNDRKYLELARFLLDCRGRNFDDPQSGRKPNPYYADHLPLTEQAEAVGHAVRTAYMFSGMADVAALGPSAEYLLAIDRLWTNVVSRKLHLTGGIGASPAGEAFGGDYDLPNASAYNETCAAIANALWNHRMFLLHGETRYIDVLERVLYNGFLSGVGMTGDCFFYPNPLEADGKGRFNHGHNERAPWFGCSCCPVNVVRMIPSVASFIYATQEKNLYVNLFVGGTAEANVAGTKVKLQQQTEYPWKGRVEITVSPEQASEFTLLLRVPGWARNEPVPSDLYRYADNLQPGVHLSVAGQPVDTRVNAQGYLAVRRSWKPGDRVTLDLDMPVRRVVSHPLVKANVGAFAVERGPLVYCAEGADNDGRVLDVPMPGKIAFQTATPAPGLLGGVTTIEMQSPEASLKLVPYYAWGHRGPNEMRVWFPAAVRPKMASHCFERDTVEACFDGREPKASNDTSIPRFTWWPREGSSEWVIRQFDQPTRVEKTAVYWFDDTGFGACRTPKSWRLLYQDGKDWKPLELSVPPGTSLNQFNEVRFPAVTTRALKIEAQLQPGFSAGILEWR